MKITFWRALAVIVGGACATSLLWHGGIWAVTVANAVMLRMRAVLAPVLLLAPTGVLPGAYALCGALFSYGLCSWYIAQRVSAKLSRPALALTIFVPVAGLAILPQLDLVGAFLIGTFPGMFLALAVSDLFRQGHKQPEATVADSAPESPRVPDHRCAPAPH